MRTSRYPYATSTGSFVVSSPSHRILVTSRPKPMRKVEKQTSLSPPLIALSFQAPVVYRKTERKIKSQLVSSRCVLRSQTDLLQESV